MTTDKRINSECDGAGPHTGTETRIYPLGGSGNLILCLHCWANENRYRYLRGIEARDPANWPQIPWASAKVYWSEGGNHE